MKTIQVTDEQWEQVDEFYSYEFPKYLDIKNKNLIVIKTEQWEGAGLKKIKVTPKDVINYYRQDNSMGCSSLSGCRTLSTFTTDWRMVDSMAKECLEIFKIINREALAKEGKKFGMELQ